VHPLVVTIPRFIQLQVPLLPLKPMAQSKRGVTQVMEVEMHPLMVSIPRFIQTVVPLLPLKPMEQSFKSSKSTIS
jgi:hypothetical protein